MQAALDVVDAQARELALPARAEVHRHARHAGQQDEHVGADLDREALGAAVLVDHARDPDDLAVDGRDGDAAAAA